MKRIPWTELPSRLRVNYISAPFLLVVLLGLTQLLNDLQASQPHSHWLLAMEGVAWSFIGPYLLLSLVGFGRLYWLNPLMAGLLVGYHLLQMSFQPQPAPMFVFGGIAAGFLINWLLCEFVYYAKSAPER